jgi:hypothetical protein
MDFNRKIEIGFTRMVYHSKLRNEGKIREAIL